MQNAHILHYVKVVIEFWRKRQKRNWTREKNMSFYKRSQWVSMSTQVGDISSIDISLKLQFVSVVKIETASINHTVE